MIDTLKRLKRHATRAHVSTAYANYTENNYGRKARLTDDAYRDRLTSWQVPAIRQHFGDLTGKVFLDIGAGDIILGEKLSEIGTPQTFYAQDLSQPSLDAGMARLGRAGVATSNFVTLSSDNFDFGAIGDGTVDAAFSNSLFSHLSINSILLCLRRLSLKMKPGAKYLSSMIILPIGDESAPYDWSYLKTKGSAVVSYPTRDPYHYAEETIRLLSSFNTGFEVAKLHDYGHPFQRLVEFRLKDHAGAAQP